MDITDEELDLFLNTLAKKLYGREKYRARGVRESLLQAAKYRSSRCGISFDLTVEDIIIPNVCPYLGVPLIAHKYEGRHADSPSLDRVDPMKGYVKGNVEVISELANRMKQNATKEQLLTFARNVISKYS